MNSLLSFPKRSIVDSNIPKSKIYVNINATQKIKDLFIKEVDKIRWEYKVSNVTVNLSANKLVKEFQIFSIYQRNEKLPESILKYIDKSIPSPIIYQLIYNNKLKYSVSVKNDKSKNYYYSKSFDIGSPKSELPVVLDIESLYYEITKQIIDAPVKKNISIEETIEVAEQIKTKEKDLDTLTKKLKTEKQFNRKVELNSQIKNIEKELEEIKLG